MSYLMQKLKDAGLVASCWIIPRACFSKFIEEWPVLVDDRILEGSILSRSVDGGLSPRLGNPSLCISGTIWSIASCEYSFEIVKRFDCIRSQISAAIIAIRIS